MAGISPLSHANDWMYFNLAGTNSPGTIALGGMKGFKRGTGWDVKKGKGTQGATLTLVTMPPIKGTITLNLVTDADFEAWYNFQSTVLGISPTQQKADGLNIFHPAFQYLTPQLTTVVVEDWTVPEEVGGKRKYQVVITLLEWQKPPAASVVSTVSGNKPDSTPFGPPPPPDPRTGALQAQIDGLNQAIKAARQP
jgi:hypothetical protein